jgi:hypothetical protein
MLSKLRKATIALNLEFIYSTGRKDAPYLKKLVGVL